MPMGPEPSKKNYHFGGTFNTHFAFGCKILGPWSVVEQYLFLLLYVCLENLPIDEVARLSGTSESRNGA